LDLPLLQLNNVDFQFEEEEQMNALNAFEDIVQSEENIYKVGPYNMETVVVRTATNKSFITDNLHKITLPTNIFSNVYFI
jgi:hypothetical protein